jgi:type IV secretion system protein VirD4
VNELYSLPQPTRQRIRALRLLVATLVSLSTCMLLLTQSAARRFGFDSLLGAPLVPAGAFPPVFLLLVVLIALALLLDPRLRSIPLLLAPVLVALALSSREPVYSPLHLLIWIHRFGHLQGLVPVFQPLQRLATAAALVHLGAFLALVLSKASLRRTYDIHGSARWADAHDVRRTGLLQSSRAGGITDADGLFLGLWRDRGQARPLFDNGPHHVFVFAPTRSGKGVGLVVPNLLVWPHSVIIYDIKGENFQLTAGYRKAQLANAVLRFDPTDPSSSRFNPLLEVRLGDSEVRDVQNIADILVDPNGDRTRDHWDRTSHALLTAVILHVLYAEADKTLRGCAEVLSRPGLNVLETLRLMLTTKHLGDRPHPTIASLAQAMLDKSDEERSGVVSTALSFLDLYRDPLVARATETSDFSVLDLMHYDRPVSLYLTVPASDLSRTRPLVRLLLNQLCRRLTEEIHFEQGRPRAHYKHPLLLMLDEFPALGRLPFFAEAMAYLAGYGIRAFLVTQDLGQHRGVYGKSESILANCNVRIAFTPNSPETADLLSQMAGQMTVHHHRVTRRSGGPFASASVTPADTQRRLLTPDEALRLAPEEALIFLTGHPPIRARRARYYEDRELLGRASFPVPALDVLPQPVRDHQVLAPSSVAYRRLPRKHAAPGDSTP